MRYEGGGGLVDESAILSSMIDTIKVRILHNANERESFLRGYEEGDPLTCVYEGDHRLPYREFAETSLEHIFASNQWVDDARRPWYDGARSLSVGDVIELAGTAYACEPIGFRELKEVSA